MPVPQIVNSGNGAYVIGPILGAVYEWELNGWGVGGGGPVLTLPYGSSGTVGCRVYYEGLYSDWAEVYVYATAPAPQEYDMEDAVAENGTVATE